MIKRAVVICSALAASFGAYAAEPLLIEAYGDSTTLGTSCEHDQCVVIPQNAVAYLQDDLRAKYGNKVKVANLGLGGTMAMQLLAGTDRSPVVPWQQRIKASRARIVTINYGINEMMQKQTPNQFYTAETALVKAATASGKVAILATSNPMPDPRLNAQLAGFIAMTRRVAQEQHVPIIDQYAYVSSLPDWQLAMSDGAHPKAALYKLKADRDFSVIDPIVEQMLANPAPQSLAVPAGSGWAWACGGRITTGS